MALCITLAPEKSVFLHTSKGEKIQVKNYGDNQAMIRIDAPETVSVLRDNLTSDQRKRYLERSRSALQSTT